MSTATKPTYCPACGRFALPGDDLRPNALLGAPVHASCAAAPSLSASFCRRYDELRAFPPKVARTVAMALGLTVCRDKKYVDHVEVCGTAARQGVSDDKWLAAVALATGRAVAAPGQGGAKIEVSVDDDGALALVVQEAVAAAAKDHCSAASGTSDSDRGRRAPTHDDDRPPRPRRGE